MHVIRLKSASALVSLLLLLPLGCIDLPDAPTPTQAPGDNAEPCEPDAPDSDSDGLSDPCDVCFGDNARGDRDGDGFCDDTDNCAHLANPDQRDDDMNGVGDVCQEVIFVSASATGVGDGSSWGDAYPTLQSALDVAPVNGQVWVAIGTYRASAPRASVARLPEGVAVFGGFDGTETDFGDRARRFGETILSGDTNGDDPAFEASGNRVDNSAHVVVAAKNARLDGFTITRGQSPANNDFPGNSGAGVLVDGQRGARGVTLENLIVRQNTTNGGSGAGLAIVRDGAAVVRNSVFEENVAGNPAPAIFVNSKLSTSFLNLTVRNNRSEDANSAVKAFGGGTHTFSYCSFVGNSTGSTNPHPTVGDSSQVGLVVRNALFWGNLGSPMDLPDRGMAELAYNCSPQDLTALGESNVVLDGSEASLGEPVVAMASGELLLRHQDAGQSDTSACVDAADHLTVDAEFPTWASTSARSDGVTDGAQDDPPDIGAHYASPRTLIKTFVSDGAVLRWTTHLAERCTLDDGFSVVEVPAESAAAGRAAPPGEYRLVCSGASWAAASTRQGP